MRIGLRTTISRAPVLDAGRLRGELRDLATDTARQIRDRTRSGRDVAGVPFQPKADGSPSRLVDTGAMVRSLRPRDVGDKRFTIGPNRGRQSVKALAHQHGGRGRPKREWLGLSQRQIDEAAQRVAQAVGKDHQ